MKKLLLTSLILLNLSYSYAQQKYEYAIISYSPSYRSLEISIGGTTYIKKDPTKEEVKGYNDVNPALREVDLMQDQGWELFNTSNTAPGTNSNFTYFFYLRKKKP